ncbi:Dehydrogenase/oxidoreductase [Corynebacterium kutscheri]|uniref:Dehydrogenase/oxidoreductase n=1 Tax=Corynebacterium kutscheri TaxID=35755 RepID=A0A0F6R0D0_9CORY|nr:SDR family NAD(P)-dependent oxidoreductase [Corynebacterium kutscheri]AKE41235.1 short chain dehydrogenase [Corynebacterium kutscheri]VEH08511.1 Dehydrogenase/oxidoreductase [Corynebacterium kutscheri]VEH09557.1 Dehydrogenase/oxidoreductase [Corynebacterium kutscheri]VEH79640.1 Dehydrogenase/oxidoreductase [Corynebacterium kutscheri]
MTAINPNDLATCLRVLEQAGALPVDDPQSQTLQHAVSKLFKEVKKTRRKAAKAARRAADAEILAATATAHPRRVDDETAGLLIQPRGQEPIALEVGAVATPHGFAGKLRRPQNCYICKKPYTLVDSFHHQLCPRCACDNRYRRQARVDLRGRRALLTGGRAKIGMYIALKLLRDGADLTITTRFPKDAVRRFSAVADSDEWLDRLHIIGIDLRDPQRVSELAEEVARKPLDILINNAAQTVRRSRDAYSLLVDGEAQPLSGRQRDVETLSLGVSTHPHPTALLAGSNTSATQIAKHVHQALSAGNEIHGIDAGGLIPDMVSHNSWVAKVGEVDPIEMLEVQLCNATAPFILMNRLRPALEAAPARRKYVVNVSAMEGVFGRGYKGAGHPHTNMAKAALNMLTRTSATELASKGILVTAVDTGWITDERPQTTKKRLAEEGFKAPLDLVDGAARVYDPIVQGENGIDLYGCFLKDYRPHPW